jgi:hypothetical protein
MFTTHRIQNVVTLFLALKKWLPTASNQKRGNTF